MTSKRVLAVLTVLALVLVMAMAAPVIAEDFEGDGEFGLMTTLISDWSCGIGEDSPGVVGADGHTGTWDKVYYIEVTVTLQRWNGSRWTAVQSQTFEKEDADFVYGAFLHNASQSGWYRTRTDHYAQHGWTTDEQVCITDAIWVSVS